MIVREGVIKHVLFVVFVLFSLLAEAENWEVTFPKIPVSGIKQNIEIVYHGSEPLDGKVIEVKIDNVVREVVLSGNKGAIEMEFSQKKLHTVVVNGEQVTESTVNPLKLWYAIIPPLIAIVIALVFKEVITALFLGVFSGSVIICGHLYGFGKGLIEGVKRIIDTYIHGALADEDHVSIIIFSMLIGGIVAIISKNGGMQGVVHHIAKYATTPRSGQLSTWFLGIAIFFDDYANTLVVGNTMRPITDKLKISREKLSYIVDATAAPIAAIAFITTWIGAELGYIKEGIANIPDIQVSPYGIFMNSLAYSFYPILTLFFMFILIWKKKDYGPMLKAEIRARNGQVSKRSELITSQETELEEDLEEFAPVEGIAHRWFNAVIPIVTLIAITFLGLLYTGWSDQVMDDSAISFGRKLSLVIGDSDSYLALMWGALTATLVAIALTVGQRIMSLSDTMETLVSGFKTMMSAIVILLLAWALAEITSEMQTASFITQMLSDNVYPAFLPAITFILGAAVAFATGSSWGTMAILYPLMLPTTWSLCTANGMEPDIILPIFFNVVSAVLAGAVLGDHCSPISDTTILSSLATSCNHIDHVKTQMPYALTVGSVSLLFGTIPAGFGLSSWIIFPICVIILYFIVTFFGKYVHINKSA